MSAKPLLLVALESEVPATIAERWNVVFTGVGKINASYALMKALASYRPSLLINYGTAGGITPQTEKVVQVGQVCQCDMDVRPLGVALGSTPFDSCPATIQLSANTRFSDNLVKCGTADIFSETPPELPCDIVDMELYALAKIAWHEQIPLIAFKYISDEADDKAAAQWKDSLPASVRAFEEIEPALDTLTIG